MTLSAVVAARARAGLFAFARWSRIPALGRFVAGRFGEAWVDPAEAEAFDLAARSAYRGDLSGDGEDALPPTATDPDETWFAVGPEPATPAFVLTPWPARDDASSIPTSAWAPAVDVSAGLSATVPMTEVDATAAPRSGPGQRRTPGDTAPEFLLRTPTNVAPVADAFFDGLVGLVEGDR